MSGRIRTGHGAVVVVVLVATLAALACGGGSKEPEIRLIPIRHLDLDGIELTIEDLVNPPFADQYPEVVAEVNGEDITGKALAAKQVSLELGRRQAGAMDFEVFGQQILADVESTDPLEALIDDELKRQAVDRLDFLPPREEAVEYTRGQEAAIARMTPAAREQFLESFRLQGFPTEDWTSNDQLVDGYRRVMGLARLKNEVCKREATVENYLNLSVRYDCDDLLREERSRADIDYFVEWVD